MGAAVHFKKIILPFVQPTLEKKECKNPHSPSYKTDAFALKMLTCIYPLFTAHQFHHELYKMSHLQLSELQVVIVMVCYTALIRYNSFQTQYYYYYCYYYT